MNLLVIFTLMTSFVTAAADESTKFLGVGYNLLTGNPDGGLLSRGGIDPGLLFTRKIFDLSPQHAVQSESRKSCAQTRQTSVFYGGKSYQNKLKRGVSFGGREHCQRVMSKKTNVVS
ncbi:MACPF domain-containing protein 8 [Elysia marginata]|uniref:MACPF domain-containing protein 8 n=1 Tax=Elysia marginata TaxID=1093978 RepID=A0AAV4FE54_9GAST|nr:MACPF domain-containing protein 8 [Elysia marginata]